MNRRVAAFLLLHTQYFAYLDWLNQFGLKWNCGGALSIFAPVVFILGAAFLVALLQKDMLIRL